jgi:outer membrane protein TolC
MTAFQAVASALTALEQRAQAEAEQARAVTASTDAVQIAHRHYRGGLASSYEVLEAQQLLVPAETQLAQIRATRLSTSVQLSQVLGGGWHLTAAQWSGPQAQSQEP